jgi:hypothetical protein
MTTTSGNDHGRIVDQVEGSVAAANERGIKLAGEAAYRNFSKYADPPIAPPRRGDRVRVGLDADGFVRQLQVLDDAAASGAPAADPVRDRASTRLAVLQAAANSLGLMSQAREEVRSDHVLLLADKWLAWVEQE